MIESAPASKASLDLRAVAAKLFEGQLDPPPSIESGKRGFNTIFRRQQTTVEDFGLSAALDRANLSEAQ